LTLIKNVITLFDTFYLVEAVNGRLDLTLLALRELKNRGLNEQGEWVGFGVK
jgi:hypothetical protein